MKWIWISQPASVQQAPSIGGGGCSCYGWLWLGRETFPCVKSNCLASFFIGKSEVPRGRGWQIFQNEWRESQYCRWLWLELECWCIWFDVGALMNLKKGNPKSTSSRRDIHLQIHSKVFFTCISHKKKHLNSYVPMIFNLWFIICLICWIYYTIQSE